MTVPGLAAVGFVGLCHLGIFGIVVPLSALGARRSALGEGRAKKRYFVGVIGQQLGLTVISVAVAVRLGIPLVGGYRPTLGGVVLAGGILAAAVIGLWPRWRRQAVSGDRRVRLIAPIDGVDHALWAVISVLAGIGEEITYRGVMYWILLQLTGSVAGSVAIAAAVFGISHVVQGWQAVVAVAGFAAVFHGLVMVTGSLYPAMVVHMLYNLVAGISYGHYVRALDRSNSFMNSTNATTLERGQAL